MNHYVVVLKDGSKIDIFADLCSVYREEKSNLRTEYGIRQSFIWVVEFSRTTIPGRSVSIATFTLENIAGYYELLAFEK